MKKIFLNIVKNKEIINHILKINQATPWNGVKFSNYFLKTLFFNNILERPLALDISKIIGYKISYKVKNKCITITLFLAVNE